MNEKKEEKKDNLYGWTEYLEDHFYKFKEVQTQGKS